MDHFCYSRDTILVAVSDSSSSPSLLGFILTDLTVNWDPVVESEVSSSSIFINVSGGSIESNVSSFVNDNN